MLNTSDTFKTFQWLKGSNRQMEDITTAAYEVKHLGRVVLSLSSCYLNDSNPLAADTIYHRG